MSFFPDYSTFISIGNIQVKWYAILILSGAYLTYYLYSKEFKKQGYTSDDADNLFMGCLVTGIIGARIWYVLFSDLNYYLVDPLRIFKIWEGGLAIHGGLIGGVIFAYIYCKKKRYSLARIADIIMPNILIAQAIGRWGNFLNQEAFGQIVTEDYFDKFPSFIKNMMFINGQYREPMFLYESILCVIGFILIKLYKKYNHPKRLELASAYLLWYGAIRFWIEVKRSDSLMFMGLKMAQIISIILMLIGLFGFFGGFRKLIKNKKPVLLFDNDGTLVDTTAIIKESFKHVFEKYKPDYKLSDEELDSFLGPTLEASFNKYFKEDKIDELVKCYKEHNDELLKEVKAIPNVIKSLESWKEKGYKLGIVSVKYKETILDGLRFAGIDEKLFDVICGNEDFEKPKPDPQGLVIALEKMQASKDNAIYVGDSPSDIEAANTLGLYSIGYAISEKRRNELKELDANRVVDDFSEIDEVLKEDISWTHNMR